MGCPDTAQYLTELPGSQGHLWKEGGSEPEKGQQWQQEDGGQGRSHGQATDLGQKRAPLLDVLPGQCL